MILLRTPIIKSMVDQRKIVSLLKVMIKKGRKERSCPRAETSRICA